MRRLWITRISAGAKLLEGSYSKMMGGLIKNNVTLNRKMLSEIAARDMAGFKVVFNASK